MQNRVTFFNLLYKIVLTSIAISLRIITQFALLVAGVWLGFLGEWPDILFGLGAYILLQSLVNKIMYPGFFLHLSALKSDSKVLS